MQNLNLDWAKIRQVLITIAAVLGFLLGLVNYVGQQIPAGDVQTLGVTNFDDVTVSGDLTAGDDVIAADDVTVGDDLAVTGDFSAATSTVSGFVIRSSVSITPTDGGTLTPTAEYVTLTPGGALGTGLAACTTGSSAVLYNSVNANVVITDTGNFVGAGNATLGQYDALRIVCIDTKWVQVSAVSAN